MRELATKESTGEDSVARSGPHLRKEALVGVDKRIHHGSLSVLHAPLLQALQKAQVELLRPKLGGRRASVAVKDPVEVLQRKNRRTLRK